METGLEACQGRARFQQHRDASCHQVSFPARQGAEGNLRHSERETLACFLSGRAKELSAISTPCKSVLKKIHAILTETLACFLPGRAKDLSALRVILF